MMLSMQAARMGSVSNKIGRCTYSTVWARPHRQLPNPCASPASAFFKSSQRQLITKTKTQLSGKHKAIRALSSSSTSSSSVPSSLGVYQHELTPAAATGRAAVLTSSSSSTSRMSTAPQYYEDDPIPDEVEFKRSSPPVSTTTASSAATDASQPPNLQHRSLLDEPWRVNVGREDDSWLHGPRPSEWFTGIHPSECPGVDPHTLELRSIPLPHLQTVTRASAQQYFDNSWTLYEALFAGLKGEEGFYRPPVHGLRHPQIFYFGHTACLYVNKLRVSGVLTEPVNPYYESIFEVGVDEMLWDDMHKNDMVRSTSCSLRRRHQFVVGWVVRQMRRYLTRSVCTASAAVADRFGSPRVPEASVRHGEPCHPEPSELGRFRGSRSSRCEAPHVGAVHGVRARADPFGDVVGVVP
jgi:hypothetical protein